MTEYEKMQYAHQCLHQLANGVDPFTKQEISSDCVLNNIHLSRCFFFVCDILRQLIDSEGQMKPARKQKKPDFSLAPEQKAQINISAKPISISVFVHQIVDLVDTEHMKRLPVTAVTTWMMAKGFLQETTLPSGKTRKTPTKQGEWIGLSLDIRRTSYGEPYQVVLYNEDAQRFVMDHLDDIIETYYNKATSQ
jgi:hypothetical protein